MADSETIALNSYRGSHINTDGASIRTGPTYVSAPTLILHRGHTALVGTNSRIW
jgi:hypothetical protein